MVHNIKEETETYSEHSHKFKMEHFAKIVGGILPLTIFPKSSTLGVWESSEYASTKCIKWQWNIPEFDSCLGFLFSRSVASVDSLVKLLKICLQKKYFVAIF